MGLDWRPMGRPKLGYDYFNQKSWYSPIYNDVTKLLSKVEKKNTAFIKLYE